jgi:beta-mannosidase
MPRTVLSLDGDAWRLGQAPRGALPQRADWQELERVDEWLPAVVPGNVQADLERAGRLPDLFWDAGPRTAAGAGDHSWWLVRDLPGPISACRRVHLVLRGVDYLSDLFLNGRHLGRHEGMFSPQVHDVTAFVSGENRLAVRILGSRRLPQDRSTAIEKLLNLVEGRLSELPGSHPHRRDTLKCQMSFGWDFCPALPAMGIWDSAYLVLSDEVHIRDVMVRQEIRDGAAILEVEVEIDAAGARPLRLDCTLEGETFDGPAARVTGEVQAAPGHNRARLRLVVPEPRLWWPWDQGEPHLYRLSVRAEGDGRLLDDVVQTLGLRRVEMEGWTVVVNGRPVYARGANWVPADILPGRVADDDYRALLTLARQANMNMLRVWGGGLREKAAFYDLCDRLGILVWQEFPFACAFLTRFPRSEGYLRLVRAEARAIVRDLRHHACLALWCGGNEFSPVRNEPLVSALRQVVSEEDASRPFLPASPAGGDSHFWQVWHNFRPPSAYREDKALFASEFGLQAPPHPEALARFLPATELWPPGPSWTFHGAGLKKLWRYARPFLAEGEVTLERFVQASQRAQAHGLQIAIEHHRRARRRGGGGALVWQLNEPWPAISWAIVDFYRTPKPAYEAARRAFSPLLVSLDYPLQACRAGDALEMEVWVLNDTPHPVPGARVQVVLEDEAGHRLEEARIDLDVPANSAARAGRLAWRLAGGERWRLTGVLFRGEEALAANEYELGVHDGIRPTAGQRLWARLARLIMPG